MKDHKPAGSNPAFIKEMLAKRVFDACSEFEEHPDLEFSVSKMGTHVVFLRVTARNGTARRFFEITVKEKH